MRYGLATSDLARWNGITDARLILVGQRIRLRPGTGQAQAAPSPAAVHGAGAPQAARRYRVQAGDTLSGIAYATPSPWMPSSRERPLRPHHVLVGTSLTIPGRM